MNLWFNNIIKSVEFMSLTSNEVDEATTGQYKQGIHRSIVLQEASGQRWLVKPALSEHLSSWRRVPPNRCYVREVGAFVISDAMKLGLVPETKLINYDDQVGSAQKWIEAKPFETMEIFNEKDVWLAGIFDLLIGQLDRHCLTGDTNIKLLDGTFATMEELSKRTENYWVYGMDETGKIVPSLASPAKVTAENVPVYEVVLDNGESVKATENHLFLMRDNIYKPLSKLVVGDSLMPLYWKRSTKGLVGYELVFQPHNVAIKKGGWHYTHQWILGKHAGKGNIIHHIDFNPKNNCPNNLIIISVTEHAYIHSLSKIGKTNEEIFGLELAAQIKEKKAKACLGKRLEDIVGSVEGAAIIKEKIGQHKRGKTYIELYGVERSAEIIRKREQTKTEHGSHVSGTTGKKYEEYMSPETIDYLHKIRSQQNKKRVLGKTWDELYGVERAAEMKKAQADRQRARCLNKNSNPNNHKIVAINFIGIVDKVYDITTETHNFGLAAGVFVHNSGNILVDNQNMPVLIDNGYSMTYTIADRSRNIIVSRFSYEVWNQQLPNWLVKMLEVTPWDKVRRELYDKRLFGRDAAAVDLFFKRLKFIQETGKASIPKFSVTRRLLHNSK